MHMLLNVAMMRCRVTGRGYMDVNRISGYIPGKMVFFLMQVHLLLHEHLDSAVLGFQQQLLSEDLRQSPVSMYKFAPFSRSTSQRAERMWHRSGSS